jgi:hypothetical protein
LWELGLVIMGLSYAAFAAGVLWLLYVAIEPYVRRHWPDSLISWTRLQAGRFRDPVVASHILVGLGAGSAIAAGVHGNLLLASLAAPDWQPGIDSVQMLSGVAPLVAQWFSRIGTYFFANIGFVLAVALLRLLVRRGWMADAATAILFGSTTILWIGGVYQNTVEVIVSIAAWWSIVWVLRRYGLLPVAVITFSLALMPTVPVKLGAWYGSYGLAALGILAALAAWALWAILSVQRRPATAPA